MGPFATKAHYRWWTGSPYGRFLPARFQLRTLPLVRIAFGAKQQASRAAADGLPGESGLSDVLPSTHRHLDLVLLTDSTTSTRRFYSVHPHCFNNREPPSFTGSLTHERHCQGRSIHPLTRPPNCPGALDGDRDSSGRLYISAMTLISARTQANTTEQDDLVDLQADAVNDSHQRDAGYVPLVDLINLPHALRLGRGNTSTLTSLGFSRNRAELSAPHSDLASLEVAGADGFATDRRNAAGSDRR